MSDHRYISASIDLVITHKSIDVKPATDELVIDIADIEVGHAEGTWVQGTGYGQGMVGIGRSSRHHRARWCWWRLEVVQTQKDL